VGTAHPVGGLDRLVGGIRPRRPRVSLGQSHQHVDEQLQHRVFRLLSQCDVEFVPRRGQTRRPLFLGPQYRSQPVDSGLVDVFGGQRGRQRLEHQARVEQVVQRGAHELEIDDDGAGRGTGIGLTDEQATVRSASHPGDLVMLDQPDGLAQHRSTHLIPLLQNSFRTQRLSHRPPTSNNVRLDAASDLRRSLIRTNGARFGNHHRLSM
jgi:hypothetical protein